MRRLVSGLIASGLLLVPVVSALGHAMSEHASFTHDRVVVVTGHDELDPALHIEAPSGFRALHCPVCVLDKRQSAAAPPGAHKADVRSPGRAITGKPSEPPVLESSGHPSPRAPPHV